MIGTRACRVDDVLDSRLLGRVADGFATSQSGCRPCVSLVQHHEERLDATKRLIEGGTVVEAALHQFSAELRKSFCCARRPFIRQDANR